ncbi:hypothetical protein Vafri_18040 [Volvox africanus]|nr:hypothetical protein Vafri_18040 [Volvox africanus]
MDAGRLSMIRCAVQNNCVGVEVGPEALARLADCELRWCGTALVVDGCLAMANCRLWGNGKVGNLNTDVRLRAAQSYSETCLAAGGPPPLPPRPDKQQEEQLPKQAQEGEQSPSAAVASPVSNRCRRRGRRDGGDPGGDGGPGTSTAAAAVPATIIGGALTSLAPAVAQSLHRQIQDGTAAGSGVGASTISPSRVAALAAAQWVEVSAAFASREHLVRVVGCEVAAPQLITRAGLHKEVRKKARELVRQVYGAPDDDLFPEWEVLVHSDLDSDMDDEDSSVTSGSVMADDEDLEDEDEDEDPLDLADDPDLDESGDSESGSESDSSSGSGSGDAADAMEYGEAASDGEAGEAEGEDEEWGVGEPLGSGLGSSDSSSDSDSRDSDSNDSSHSSGSGGERDSSTSGGSTEGAGGSSERDN